MKKIFKLGDIVKGIEDNGYSYTNEDMKKGIVISLQGMNDMAVKILEHNDKGSIGEIYIVDNDDKKFRLIIPTKMTIDDLKEGDIVTLRNGDRLVFHEDTEEFEDLDSGNNNLSDLCDLNDDLTMDVRDYEQSDIVKVERPFIYETIFKRDEIKEMTIKEISDILGYEVKVVKEKNND